MSDKPNLPLVNKQEETVTWSADTLCASCTSVAVSPIDEYYELARELLTRSARPDVSADQMLMRLLLLELVSGAELYFRRILSSIIGLCPLTRAIASRSQVSLGAAYYYGADTVALALIEHTSLSGQDEIRKYTKQLTEFDIKQTSSEGVALADFERVCHLRHAAVHARGELGSRNLAEIGIKAIGRRQLFLSPISFRTIVVKTHNAVRAYNRFLFDCTMRRWVREKVLTGVWERDKEVFEPVHKLFYSKEDGVGDSDPKVSYERVWQALV